MDDDERSAAEYWSVECLETNDDSDKIGETEAIKNIVDSSLSYDIIEHGSRRRRMILVSHNEMGKDWQMKDVEWRMKTRFVTLEYK